MNTRKKTLHMGGKLLTLLQLVLSAGLLVVTWNSGVLPMKYIVILSVVMLLLFGVTFGLQYLNNKVYILGIVLSIIISAGMAVGIVYMLKADKLMKDVGGATYKTDNMIVVVKKDSPAANLLDAKGYRFGIQTAVDQENNKLMQKDIERAIGKEIKVEEYSTLAEEAEALLKGRVEAAIYNEAFSGIIEDAVEGYSDQVRILYQYGIDTELEQEEKNIEEPFNIYISGIDVDGPITTNSRSDVNIIMTVNPNTKKILLTTTPRDYYVTIPGVSGEQKDKLTHAGIYGVDVSMNTLESIYGIDITYYARANFTSLISIVDALGGVDVNSDYTFTTTHGGYEIQQGINHMDGPTALGFARERYSFEEGDNQRGKNQEAVLTAILHKGMSPAILTKASQIIASVGDSLETNMTQEEISKFINMQLSAGSSWTIESVAATGTGDNQPCFSSGDEILYVMNPNETSLQEISEKMKQIIAGN
ncbi:LCP family protein [Faecalicatena contorta]|uniref:Cell envelope-related function transcriptional attenuator common domain-containing protein n=1 Tax=Faecalicatena contorta TaxID=39482 RepID=A0A316A1X9_9FIRM|nr:LCP family protein [Faecalicatena contorta]PWJ51552.1 LytR family transcriptional attenuator [Faecalicatena contorta]SUQ13108.1 cell envelope-related function transcriptional attenuator common domain-containing protein [Faecalicatena contorta]